MNQQALKEAGRKLQHAAVSVHYNPHFVVVCLTLLIITDGPVGQPVDLRRGSQHKGEAHKERRVLGQRTVSVCHITRLTGEICAAARGVAYTDTLSWRQKYR